jgi:tRNA dimethylallyltransferase
VLDNLTPPPRYPDIAEALEARADAEGIATLYQELSTRDALAATRMEPTNRRRIVRALEVTLGSGMPFSSFGPGMEVYPEIDCRLIGLSFDRAELDARIARRLNAQLAAGFLTEVQSLIEDHVQLSRTAAQAIGYRELAEVVQNTLSLAEAVTEILRRSRNLARRQLAWLRRDPRIIWVDGSRPDLGDHVARLVESSKPQEDENARGHHGPV